MNMVQQTLRPGVKNTILSLVEMKNLREKYVLPFIQEETVRLENRSDPLTKSENLECTSPTLSSSLR